MAQSNTTGLDNKQTADELSSIEFNSLNLVINDNANDAEPRLNTIETVQAENEATISIIENASSIATYQEHNLPTQNTSDGQLAYNSTRKELVYFKHGSWHFVKDNDKIILVSGLSFLIDTSVTTIPATSDHLGESLDTQFTLPFVDDGVYNCTIDWDCNNPGTDTEAVTTPGRITHTYSTPGQYLISISGIITGFRFDYYETSSPTSEALDSALKMVDLRNFGSLVYTGGSSNLTSAGDAFMKCHNMIITAPDAPDTSASTDFLWMFYQNRNITQVPLLDVSIGNRFWAMFRDCRSLQTLPDFNFDNGVAGAGGNKFPEMFRECYALTTLDNVTFGDMDLKVNGLFQDCNNLANVPSSMSFSNVTNFQQFMKNCTLITEFPQYSQITNGTNFIEAWYGCALTAQAIENILGGLVANGRSGLTTSFAGGTNAAESTWTAQAQTHVAALRANGWTVLTN